MIQRYSPNHTDTDFLMYPDNASGQWVLIDDLRPWIAALAPLIRDHELMSVPEVLALEKAVAEMMELIGDKYD